MKRKLLLHTCVDTSLARIACATVLTVVGWILPIIIVYSDLLGRFEVHQTMSVGVVGCRDFGVLGQMIITWSIHDRIEARAAATTLP